jgi:hypothetical protein
MLPQAVNAEPMFNWSQTAGLNASGAMGCCAATPVTDQCEAQYRACKLHHLCHIPLAPSMGEHLLLYERLLSRHRKAANPGPAMGFPVPDPNCTPGAVNPTPTIEVLRDRSFSTRCVRDAATKEVEKAATYDWYGLQHPSNNSGESQICELDHLISLELGGADTLDKHLAPVRAFWSCTPTTVLQGEGYGREFLAMQVRAGRMDLIDEQRGIATDWIQFLDEARRACPEGRC